MCNCIMFTEKLNIVTSSHVLNKVMSTQQIEHVISQVSLYCLYFRVFSVTFLQSNLGNLDSTAEQWKIIFGNLALTQVSTRT